MRKMFFAVAMAFCAILMIGSTAQAQTAVPAAKPMTTKIKFSFGTEVGGGTQGVTTDFSTASKRELYGTNYSRRPQVGYFGEIQEAAWTSTRVRFGSSSVGTPLNWNQLDNGPRYYQEENLLFNERLERKTRTLEVTQSFHMSPWFSVRAGIVSFSNKYHESYRNDEGAYKTDSSLNTRYLGPVIGFTASRQIQKARVSAGADLGGMNVRGDYRYSFTSLDVNETDKVWTRNSTTGRHYAMSAALAYPVAVGKNLHVELEGELYMRSFRIHDGAYMTDGDFIDPYTSSLHQKGFLMRMRIRP